MVSVLALAVHGCGSHPRGSNFFKVLFFLEFLKIIFFTLYGSNDVFPCKDGG